MYFVHILVGIWRCYTLSIIYKVVTLCVLIAVLVMMWLPQLHISENVLAKQESRGATIAGVDVTGLEGQELEKALQTAVAQWTAEPIMVSGGGERITVDSKLLIFDIQATIDTYEAQVNQPWYAFWEQQPTIHLPLAVQADEQLKEQLNAIAIWDADKTYAQIVSQAAYLKERIVQASLKDMSLLETERLALSLETIPAQAFGVETLANVLDETMIYTETPMSFLQLTEQLKASVNNEAQNFVASMLYHIVLQTDYEILQRHPQPQIPTYLQPGFEAEVNKREEKDLQFINHSDVASKLNVQVEGNVLQMELTAQTKTKEVKPRVETNKIVNPKTITRYSTKLAVNQQQIVQEGKTGLRVFVYRSIAENGKTQEEFVSRDYYAPVNRIVVKSTNEPEAQVPSSTTNTDLQMDLNGDSLPDIEDNVFKPILSDPRITLPKGSYYDKAGNLVTP